MIKTEWYPIWVRPVRVGFYERFYPSTGRTYYSFWDGVNWHMAKSQPSVSAARSKNDIALTQNLPWRGVMHV